MPTPSAAPADAAAPEVAAPEPLTLAAAVASLTDLLAETEADARLASPPASVTVNAPLALVQADLATRRSILRHVLGLLARVELQPAAPIDDRLRERVERDDWHEPEEPNYVAVTATIRMHTRAGRTRMHTFGAHTYGMEVDAAAEFAADALVGAADEIAGALSRAGYLVEFHPPTSHRAFGDADDYNDPTWTH